jgi:serine/threonine-protein kinase
MSDTTIELRDDKRSDHRILLHSNEHFTRYDLTALKGKGGAGRVWIAHDLRLNRDVALKELISSEPNNAQARFLREARITSQLEHPSIVPIYELDLHQDDGAPYYTMRLINGDTLREVIRRHHSEPIKEVSFARLVQHFIDVCHAIAYAHSRNIIHRDLKPSNVVVGEFGETVVLDWGLAKDLNDAHDEAEVDGMLEIALLNEATAVEGAESAQTVVGNSIGTPAFMSPEQAIGDLDKIDRRSDVYGLGAILYELLTSEPPFHGDTASMIIGQVIRGKLRDPQMVNPHVSSQLAAICMKCMQTTPTDRYASVDQIIVDLHCFLHDEPVSVYRDSWFERISRWTRQRKVSTVVVIVMLLTSVVGLGISNVLISDEHQLTEQARDRADRAAETADYERRAALAQYRRAHMAVEQYLTDVRELAIMKDPNQRALQEKLLNSALQYYDTFLAQETNSTVIMAQLADASIEVSNVNLTLGRLQQAKKTLIRGRELFRSLVGRDPGNVDYRIGLTTISLQRGFVATRSGDHQRAIWHYSQGIEIVEATTNRHLDNVANQVLLVTLLSERAMRTFDLAEREPAIHDLDQAFAIVQKLQTAHPQQKDIMVAAAITFSKYAHIYGIEGRSDDAIRFYKDAQAIYQRLLENDPDNLDYQNRRADLITNIGANMESASGIDFLREAVELREQISSLHPEVPDYRHRLGKLLLITSNTYQKLADVDKSSMLGEQALEVYRDLVLHYPRVPDYTDSLAGALNQYGIAALNKKDYALAVSFFDEAMVIADKLYAAFPSVVDYRVRLGQLYYNLALSYRGAEKLDLCVEHYQGAIENYEAVHQLHPERHRTVLVLARCHNNVANALRLLEKTELAMTEFAAGVEYHLKSVTFPKSTARHVVGLANAQQNLGLMLQLAKEHEDAVDKFQAAIENYERALSMLEEDPLSSGDWPSVRLTKARVQRYLVYSQAALSN